MTRRITEKTRESIRADRKAGSTLDQLTRKYGVSKTAIYESIQGIPYARKEQLRLIAARLNSPKGYTDEEIAKVAMCDVSLVAERRALHSDTKRRIRSQPCAMEDDDRDTGARISPTWLRQHCSHGERTIYQIQAWFGSRRVTLADVIASVQKAGLPFHPASGLVGVHTPERVGPTEFERRIKVGVLTGRKLKIH